MFRSKIKLLLKITGGLVFLAVFLVCAAIIYGIPDNPVNIALFRVAYEVPFTRHSFLEFYSPRRRDVDNGNIPAEIDSFLCERLETSNDRDEIAAIIHLYGVQAGGREGESILQRTERTQEKIAAEIMGQLESGSATYLAGKIVLLDEIRIGKRPGKGALGGEAIPRYPESEPAEGWVKWSDTNEAPIAVPHLRTWWNSGLSWQEKKKIDPFAGTNVRIGYCC